VLRIAAAVGAALAALTFTAPTANATPIENTHFIQSLLNQGWQIWDLDVLIAQGNQVCYNIDNISGWTGADSMNMLYNSGAYSWDGAVQLVAAAVDNICPEFLPGHYANSNPDNPAPWPAPPPPPQLDYAA